MHTWDPRLANWDPNLASWDPNLANSDPNPGNQDPNLANWDPNVVIGTLTWRIRISHDLILSARLSVTWSSLGGFSRGSS